MTLPIKLSAKKRTVIGRKVKQLRRQGKLPANIYGRETKSLAIELSLKEFKQVYKLAGETNLVELKVEGETKPRSVLIGKVQSNAVSDEWLHVDFRQVDLTKTVIVSVPVELTGAAPAVLKGGVLVRLINELEIEALPQDLPDKITVDVAGLTAIGQGISLRELKLDTAKLKLAAANLDEYVVKIETPSKEEESVAASASTLETPTSEVASAADEANKVESEEKKQREDQGKKPAANKP
jgi:large subunit ribosomal protein L25